MPSKRFLSTAAPLALLALAGMGLATAQSSSPFASNKKAQAWERPVQPYQAPAYDAPAYQAPAAQGVAAYDAPIATRPRPVQAAAPTYRTSSTKTPPKTYGGQPAAAYQNPTPYQAPAPSYEAQAYSAQNLAGAATPPAGSDYVYTPPRARAVAQAPDFGTPAPPSPRYGSSVPPQAPAQPTSQSSGSPYAPQSGQQRRPQAWENVPQNAPPQPTQPYGAPAYQGSANQGYVPGGYQQPAYQTSTPPTGAPYPSGPYSQAPQQPRSWKDKLGLGNLATVIRGKFNLGAAATYREQPPNQIGPDDGWSEDFIGDGEIEFEVSAITQGGLEYGVNLGGRAQYDPYRRGFGGRLPESAGTGLRGHTSGFYAGGEDIAVDAQAAVESAHIFLRSAYGDVTIGRDDGAAYLFSLGAPTLLAVGASNSAVDYTGYDSVKTINDASGFAEKVTYTSPRLLGDQIGVGVQLGVSYALDGDVCGVDYCNGKNIDGTLQPEIEDIVEAGLALDRTFDNGLSVELTGTYARGSEKSGAAGMDDLQSYGAGLEFAYDKWTLGGSFLQSNNGLLDGDYTAYDAGVTWQPGLLGFTLGYGHAKDDNVGLKSDQATFGVTYDFDKFTLGTGVQYVDRSVDGLIGGVPTTLDQKATSVFVQGGFKF